MNKYADIIARLESATGPSEELSARVKCALLAPEGAYVEQSRINSAWCVYVLDASGNPLLFEWRGVPPVIRNGDLTASLDAAIGLAERMMPGCDWLVRSGDREHDKDAFFANLQPVRLSSYEDDWIDGKTTFPVWAKSAQTAILISMFRALQARSLAS